MGVICWCVMVSLGEMVSYLPIAGGHIRLAERFCNRALSFAMGWNYWYNWVIVRVCYNVSGGPLSDQRIALRRSYQQSLVHQQSSSTIGG